MEEKNFVNSIPEKNKGGRPKNSRNKTLSTASQDFIRPKVLKIVDRLIKLANKNKEDIEINKWVVKELSPYCLKKMPVEQNIQVTGFEDFIANAGKNKINMVKEEQKN